MDVERIKGIDLKTEEEIMVQSSDSEKVSLLAFKVMNDSVGSLTFCRIYSGKVESGMQLLNSVKDKRKELKNASLCILIQEKISRRHMLGIL